MEYTIQHRKDQNIVIATAKGEWDSKTDNDMVRKIMETVDASGSMKVLLDIQKLQFDLSIHRVFECTQEVMKQRDEFENVSRKVAIVYPSTGQKVDENIIFFETVARNRGLPYRAFKDMDIALAWLLDEG